jgi:1-phosphatidylinositol-3-phosphate 5-kinase
MDALTKFAPAYFDYTRKAFQGHVSFVVQDPSVCPADDQRPSVLAKIYGFFKIGYRNAVTGRSMRMNVLIMENLFYDRRFSKVRELFVSSPLS